MKRVLVVDDELSIVKLLSFNLEKEGYAVTTAEDGKEGYELALNEKFDFIILDVMLPSMDGLDIAKNYDKKKLIRLS